MNGILHGLLEALFPPAPEALDEACVGRVATVRGQVVPRDVITSPLGGEPCVYYRYQVEEWRRSTVSAVGGDGFWQVVTRDESICEFYVHDGKRRALVAPFAARIETARGVAPQRVALGADRRASELRLAAGDTIEVAGEFCYVDDLFDDHRGYRASPRRLCVRAPSGRPLRVRILQS